MLAREAMSGADAAWFHMDRDHNLMVVNTVLCFDQRPDWNKVEAVLQMRVADRFPRFRQRAVDPLVTFGLLAPWWEEDASFDIEHHVERTDLSARGGREALDQHIAMRATLDLDRHRPLWRAELIDLAGGAAALLLRTHHAIGDGAALLKVISAMTDPLGEPPAPPRAAAPRPWNPVDPVLVERTVIATASLGQRLFARGATGTPLTSPIVGAKQIAHLEPIELHGLKDLARSTGSTVNDVFLAALAGAVREHFAGLGMSPVDVDIVMPVSVRDDGHEAHDALGNRFGLVFSSLPVATADRRERRGRVTERTRALKSSQEPEVVFGALSAMGHVPRAVQHAWVDAFIKDAVAVVTNVPGPRHAVSLAGIPVTQMYFLVPSTGPIGLGISFLSYNGHAVVSLIADRATLPALGPFAARLESELHQA
jgi:hypothetical protein